MTHANGGNTEEPEPGTDHPSDNGSGASTSLAVQSLTTKPSGSQRLTDRKATGPRTELGKQTASRNATKHGVFSKVILLKDESPTHYERLLTGLWEVLQPEGALEELLVEKLAITIWRQRRLLIAEGAEIQKNREFPRQVEPLNNVGLIKEIDNPDILKLCLELLTKLQTRIEDNGLCWEEDTALLTEIYGDRKNKRLRRDLYDSYTRYTLLSEIGHERQGDVYTQNYGKIMLMEIGVEISRLRGYRKKPDSIETARGQLEFQCRSVPDAPGLDRLLRYEASLERVFDRTLSQLERLQQMRLGKPVPPPIQVHVNQ